MKNGISILVLSAGGREPVGCRPGDSWERVFRLLSYFDVKNLASRITCPVIMGVGLQDEVCPPHTDFAGYNQVKAPKRCYVCPDKGHTVGKEWRGIRNEFFRSFCK